jgi:CubicO group peptidase (beta-lactamase class C family)
VHFNSPFLSRGLPGESHEKLKSYANARHRIQWVALLKLSLGDTVEGWLPGRVPDRGSITIRQLLNHTSGLRDGASEGQQPGFFAYANKNYELLAAVVRAVEGRATTMRLRLQKPLGPRDTVWPSYLTRVGDMRRISRRGAIAPCAP